MFAGILVVAASALLWVVLGNLLSSDRGLDVTDEGLYLLAANPPSQTAVWYVPFGWSTAPLFSAVAHDIASFRTAGAVLLVLAGTWLGWSSVQLAHGGTRRGDVGFRALAGRRRRSRLALGSLGAITGALGSLLFYTNVLPLLRTPGYNWANILGLTLFAAGVITLISVLDRDGPRRSRVLVVACSTAASLGLFITVPAKPSTMPISLLLAAALLVLWLGGRRGILCILILTGFVGMWLLVALVTTWWPTDFVSVFARGLGMPAPVESQTVLGAIREILVTPKTLVAEFWGAPRGLSALLLLGLVIQGATVVVGRHLAGIRTVGFMLTAAASWWMPGMLSYLGLALGVLLLVVREPNRGIESPAARRTRMQRSCSLILFLGLQPFVYAFGSSNGLLLQAGMAEGFIAVLAVVLAVGAAHRYQTWLAVLTVTAFTLTSFASALGAARERPYRIAPIEQQSTPLAVGAHGATLLVDTDLHAVLTSLRAQAVRGGWSTSDPLTGTVWIWSSTVPYFLGARPPESLMLTLLGYTSSPAIAEYNLGPQFEGFPWESSWLLTSTPASLEASASADVQKVLTSFEVSTGRAFPADFVCVAQSAELQLWRPAMEDDFSLAPGVGGSGACPPGVPAESRYDFFLGWRR